MTKGYLTTNGGPEVLGGSGSERTSHEKSFAVYTGKGLPAGSGGREGYSGGRVEA